MYLDETIEIKNKILEYNYIYSESGTIQQQQQQNALHPHNEATWNFINSDYYDFDVYKKHRKIFESTKDELEWLTIRDRILTENQQSIIQHDIYIRNKGVRNIEKNDMLPYLKFLNIQISVETAAQISYSPPIMYCRQGCDKHLRMEHLDDIDYAFKMSKKLRECNKKGNWDEIVGMGWIWPVHIISLSWTLYEMGLGEYTIKLLEPIYETINSMIKQKGLIKQNILSNLFSDGDIFGSYPYDRIKNSVAWSIGMSYNQVGNKEKCLEALRFILNCPPESWLCYRLKTRHLEAAIRIYSLEKNDKNLEILYSTFEKALTLQPDENSESLMERCVAMYDFLYKVIE